MMGAKSRSLAKAENELVDLYRCLKDSGAHWDQPFLAGRGKHYCCSTPKALFVGKATGGWSDIEDPCSRKKIREASDQLLDAGGRSSPFWNYMRGLGQQIFPNCREPLSHIAWTNIARLGYERKNPEGKNFTQQKAVCKKLLEAEILALKPNLIILLTNNYQWRFVKEFFSSVSWQCLPDPHGYAWSGIWRNQTSIVWTRHPQGKSETKLKSERRAIIDCFRRSVVNESS